MNETIIYRAFFINKQGKKCIVVGNYNAIKSLKEMIDVETTQQLVINEKLENQTEVLLNEKKDY